MASAKRRRPAHTPAPWTFDQNCVTADFNGVGICILEVIEGFWCGDVARHPTGEEYLANATLITAAPLLLAAAKRAWRAMLAAGPFDDGTPEGVEMEAAMDALSVAVSQAGGRCRET